VRVALLAASGVLAAIHVIGVLFARPLLRPAEVLATLCLLLCCTSWGLRAATAALVAGAALTLPPRTADGAGLQILSPEQYDGLVQQSRLESLIPVIATLLFVLAVLVHQRNRPGRLPLALGITAAVLVTGWVVTRAVLVDSAAALVPLLLALAAIALAVTTATRRERRATVGAVLLVAAATLWIDSAIRATELSYAIRDNANLFSLDLITPTDTFPQPTQALIAAVHLTAAILVITALTQRNSRVPAA
jgi:hypothetical protein